MKSNNRIWEIDFARGIAVILMVIFHFIFDLDYLDLYNVNVLNGFWYYEGLMPAIIFIFVSGICSSISNNNIKRGLYVFSLGIVLSITTYLIDPKLYIKFGILHLIGICMILSFLFKKLNSRIIATLSIFTIILGFYFKPKIVAQTFLYPLGLVYNNFSSLDYYPLVPWLGVFLLGIIIAKSVYINKKSVFQKSFDFNVICFFGKHSLIIYLIHQPIILGLLKLIGSYK